MTSYPERLRALKQRKELARRQQGLKNTHAHINKLVYGTSKSRKSMSDTSSPEYVKSMVKIDSNQSDKLRTLKRLTSSDRRILNADIPGFLQLFSDDDYRYNALEYLLNKTDILTENILMKIAGSFSNVDMYATEIIDITGDKLPPNKVSGIMERFRKKIGLEDEEGKDSLTINDFTFTKLKPEDSIDNLELYGKKLTIKIANQRIEIKYKRNTFNKPFINGMEIDVRANGTIETMNDEEEGQ